MPEIKNLIFDLDGTLYPYSSGTQELFEKRIVLFFQKKFGVSAEEAVRQRDDFMARYRNSQGFQDVAEADKKEFMDFICDIDVSMLKPDIVLAGKLASLPQRKIIVTDSTVKHAHDTLKQLHIGEKLFDEIFDCERSKFVFKPQEEVLLNAAARCGIRLSECMFFEDKVKNLETAKKLGMQTVWISEIPEVSPPFVDYQFCSAAQALETLF